MNRLTQIEASRMVAVLDEALEKLGFLADVDFEALSDPVIDSFDPEVQRLIRRQRKCEQAYVAALEQDTSLSEINMAAKQLRESARALTRRLKRDVDSATLLGAHCSGHKCGVHEFRDVLAELQEQTKEQLHTTVEQAKAKAEFLQELQAKIERAEEDRQALQLALDQEVTAKQTRIAEHNSIISKLRAELSDIKQSAQLEAAALAKESKEQEAANVAAFFDKKQACTEELHKLSDQLSAQTKEHAETEETLRKKKFKVEMEVQNLISRFDREMSEKEAEMQDLLRKHAEEKQRLRQLKEYFDLVDRNLGTQAEEERAIAEQKAREEAEMQRLHSAAAAIQVGWRKFIAKRDAKKKEKKGKGKKGKGKKGKGKGKKK